MPLDLPSIGSYQSLDAPLPRDEALDSSAPDGASSAAPLLQGDHADDSKKRRRWSNLSTVSQLRPPKLHLRRYRRRRWFIPLFVLAILLALGGIIGGSFASYMNTSFAFRSRATAVQELEAAGDYITLNGKVTAVDLNNAKITVLWTLFGCGSTLTGSDNNQDCMTPDFPFDVYQNENTTRTAHKRSTNTTAIQYDPTKRVFGFDPQAQTYFWEQTNEGGPGYIWGHWQTWSQDLPFSISYLTASKKANDLAYPFDKYKIVTTLLVVQPEEMKTYSVIPTFSGVISNWAISTNSFNSNASDAFDWIDKNSQQLQITVERSGAAIAFALCIFIVNWTITLVVLFQLMLILIWRREFAESLVLFPITALFAMPALRSVAPGNPSFGSFYDVCGFVLQISLVGLSSAIILLTNLIGDEHGYDPKEEGLSRARVFRDFESLFSKGRTRQSSDASERRSESGLGEETEQKEQA